MEISQITDKITIINNIENKIRDNCLELLSEYYKVCKEFEKENPLIKVNAISGFKFTVNIEKYEIFFVVMNECAIAEKFDKTIKGKPTLSNITHNISEQNSYCGCINIYYSSPSFDKNIVTYIGRNFVNKNFDVGFQVTNNTIDVESKDLAFKRVKNHIIVSMNEIFNTNFSFLEVADAFQIDKELLSLGKNKIGFK